MKKQNTNFDLEKMKRTIRKNQILPCEVIEILNDREVIIKVKGFFIMAYTNLNLHAGNQLYLRIDQVEPQLRFKLLTSKEYDILLKSGIDYII